MASAHSFIQTLIGEKPKKKKKKKPFHDPLQKNTIETLRPKHNKTIVSEFQIRKLHFVNKHSMRTENTMPPIYPSETSNFETYSN